MKDTEETLGYVCTVSLSTIVTTQLQDQVQASKTLPTWTPKWLTLNWYSYQQNCSSVAVSVCNVHISRMFTFVLKFKVHQAKWLTCTILGRGRLKQETAVSLRPAVSRSSPS